MQRSVRCLLFISALCWSHALSAQRTVASQPVIAAYVFPQNNPIQPGEIAAQKLTRINYAFANLQGGKIVKLPAWSM